MFRKLVNFRKEGLNLYHGELRITSEICDRKTKLSSFTDKPAASIRRNREVEFWNTCARHYCILDMFYLRFTTSKVINCKWTNKNKINTCAIKVTLIILEVRWWNRVEGLIYTTRSAHFTVIALSDNKWVLYLTPKSTVSKKHVFTILQQTPHIWWLGFHRK